MTAATAPPAPAGSPARGTAPLAGAGTLLRFAARRDRVRLPVWTAALVLGTVTTAGSYRDLYPTAEARRSTAETMSSPAALAMSGPERFLADYGYGAMLGHQMLGFTAVLVALMSVLTVTRHTRAEEESGRAELVRSAAVGRHAPLAAALALAVLTNAVLACVMALGLGGLGLPGAGWGGSLLYGAAHAAVGLVFTAVAAVTVQLTAHARGASGAALAVLGLAYVLRAAGDVGGGALSWLSPVGWAQRTYVYVDDRWWPLLLALGAAAAGTTLAVRLSTRRDLGAGLRPARSGRPHATAALTHPLGFALRLHRGLLTGFAVGLAAMGAAYGAVLGDAEEMLADVAALEDALAELGGADLAESFAAMVMIVLAVVAAVYVVLAALRPRAEESGRRAEPLLATALSRTRWAGSHLAVALAGGTLLLLLAGLGFGAAGAAATGDGSLVPALTGAALAYAPALWVTAGVAAALYGWLPQATALAWVMPVLAFVVGYLGPLLQLPQWLSRLSPFGHVPRLPAEPVDWTPLVVLTLLAAALIASGLAGFRRRDVVMA
ncbi:ABC transporter permease [Streptomyces sp. TRM 70351]|uniref:ABC transporter permease n=1 Tax=Streptomyces sp. TRM 70351 TaxID=3116552 RepID=UPI002E7BE9B0|nr:ABC transporter permease [Streptomyces sp. TRM 70351]MEE1929876.1 ABC transporter permease [Streptomyces sp. TRM 70351]